MYCKTIRYDYRPCMHLICASLFDMNKNTYTTVNRLLFTWEKVSQDSPENIDYDFPFYSMRTSLECVMYVFKIISRNAGSNKLVAVNVHYR